MRWPWQKRASGELWEAIPLFAELSSRERQEIGRLLQRKTYDPGETIFQQGNPGVGLFVVVTGSVEVKQEEDDGTILELATVKPGEFFGELALLDDTARSASAVAVDETSVVSLFRTDLVALAETRPRLGVKILMQLSQIVAERLRRTNRALKEVRLTVDSEGA